MFEFTDLDKVCNSDDPEADKKVKAYKEANSDTLLFSISGEGFNGIYRAPQWYADTFKQEA